MATEVTDLKEQIEKAKESLKNVDENIKKITGRDPNEPRPNLDGRRLSGGGSRGREFGGILGRRGRDVQEQGKDSEPAKKRVAVFSRLGPSAGRRRVVLTGRRTSKQEEENEDEEDDQEEEEEQKTKPAVQSSVVSTAKKITKSELISAQNAGEKGKARNRRMFGMLLGTLARFDKDSQGRQTKQAQKQKEVETRLEEETAEERKKLASQRRSLFSERRSQQRRISLLEQKVALADELVEWEKEWNKKSNFIMTKASPGIFFMPKDFTPRTQRALQDSKERIKEIIKKHKKSVEETMSAYDDEIKMLDGKQDGEDGKGDKNEHGNNMGSHVLNSRKRGAREEEPEEEMDLDSMEPQVDIKVEMDENEGDDVEKDVVRNGAAEIKKKVEITQHEDEQNHDIAMDDEGNTEHVGEYADDTNTQMTMKQEAMDNSFSDNDSAKAAQDETHHGDSDKVEEGMDVEIKQSTVDEHNNKNKLDYGKGEHSSEGAGEDMGMQGDADPTIKAALLQSEPDSVGIKDPAGEGTAKPTDDDAIVESGSEIRTEEPVSQQEVVSAAKAEGRLAEKMVSKESSSDVDNSENDRTNQTSKSSEASRKSLERLRDGKPSKSAPRGRSKQSRGDSSSSGSDSDKETAEKKKMKPRPTLTRSRSPDKDRSKVKPKEPVGRRTSASERKARLRKRRKSESSSDSDSSSSSSSSSSEDDRRKKRSSRSRRNEVSSKRQSRERASRRSSGSRRRSRSRSRERISSRRDRHRR